jgi:diguanylate cyclase (GGDEF)-like protein
MIAAAPWIGWGFLALFGISVLNQFTLDRRIARSVKPERVVAASVLLTILLIAVGIVLSGGPGSPVLSWFAIPVSMAATRFRLQVVLAAIGVTLVVMLAVAVGAHPGAAAANPVPLIASLVVVIAVASITVALMGAELQYRGESVLDPLTGMLNRNGLQARFAEVSEQAALLGQPVCLITCDLDRFKAVNDTYGHDRGDAVLRDAAYAMRKALRSFELFYRLGGEEFVVMVPGVSLHEGLILGERVRASVEGARASGVQVTTSVGVSAAAGDDLEYQALFRAADDALYRAKDAGGNKVMAAVRDVRDEPTEPTMVPLHPSVAQLA